MADTDVTLAALLRRWRGRVMLTQEQLAVRTGLGVRTIRRLESRQLRSPRADSLRRLADALDLSDAERGHLAAAARGDEVADVPRQLPRDVAGFTGRDEQLREMDLRLTASAILVVTGTAGVGKTALAVHWGHRVADRFPGGQLYVNLRGFDPGGTPVDPSAAVRGFLDALGVPPSRVPPDPDARAALYRTLLAGKRMLVLLDNARDAGQVRPLLPASEGCLVVVTSRDRLAGLVATEGAASLTLEPFPAAEAAGIMVHRLGPDRIAAETRAAGDIVAMCAGLPLALVIAAAHAATRPRLTLDALAAELRDSRRRLDVLSTGEAATDVRALFSWSYERLGEPAARLFGLLGRHPGPDISTAAAASLAGVPPSEVRPLLAELTKAHLLTEHLPGRYTFHDLLREYAAELGVPDLAGASVRRVLCHYLHTGRTAALLLYPYRQQIGSSPVESGVHAEDLADQEEALAWFTAEHEVLVAAISMAAGAGLDEHAWHIAWTLPTYLERQNHPADFLATQDAALAAACRLGDAEMIASSYRARARAALQLGDLDGASDGYRKALEICGNIGDRMGQAAAHNSLGQVLFEQGRVEESIGHAERAAALYQQLGHQAGHADAVNAIGWAKVHLGDYEAAIEYCRQALDLQEQIGNHYGTANSWHSIGYAHQHLGRYGEAVECYLRARDGYRSIGARYYEAATLRDLGDAHCLAGERDPARRAWREAIAIFEDLDHAEAGGVRARLDRKCT